MRKILCAILLFLLPLAAFSQRKGERQTLSGRVTEADGKTPVPGAVIRLDDGALWTSTDKDGAFVLDRIPEGTYRLEVDCLGYVPLKETVSLRGGRVRKDYVLHEQNLALDEAVVTAELQKENLNTTQTIGRQALDHLQLSGVSNITALLPGGKTVNPDLTTATELSVRGGGSGAGNAAFATAVEVNGVRMGDNASFGGLSGIDTRSLQVENIESVEVISGVPSAEYGDLGSGMIRVKTKQGRSPVSLTFSVNPRTYSAAVSKGIDLKGGSFNISGEWTRATQKLTSPYTSYTRRGFTAEFARTFARTLRLEAGLTGNIGGMNSKDDPDAFSQAYSRGNDNLLTPHAKITWLINRSWITNLSLEGSVYYHDMRTHEHIYNSYASSQPAVHAEEEGYWLATPLPLTFYADRITDSRELDYAASLKYDWLHHFGRAKSVFKAGVQWKADGNVGRGEYYEDPALAANGYRPRPYTDYPYLHNLALFAEEKLTVPLGKTSLDVSAGLRSEQAFLAGTAYRNLRTLSPRFNARWNLSDAVSLRGGWGITRKLPSFYVLFPRQEYRDIQTFGFSYGEKTSYLYYTQPFTMAYNPDLRWQCNRNAEVGIDLSLKGFKLSLAGFRNRTQDPYEFGLRYEPFSYSILQLPADFSVPADPTIVTDHQRGDVFIRGSEDEYYTPMGVRVADRTFAGNRYQRGGADILRTGAELTADFPEIPLLHTRLRLDAAYTRTEYENTLPTAYYPSGWSHSSLPNRSYEYAAIYAGSTSSVAGGRRMDNLDANLTAITHIPAVRLILTCRIEATLLRSAQNRSSRAFTVASPEEAAANPYAPTGGNIYDGNSYTAVCPIAYIDLDGVEHAWTDASAADPVLQRLILRSGNAYTFARDGYNPYLSANVSLTKEIGDHVSLSFFANNFTNARPYRKSWATGVSALFTPAFYYGLTCRIKL